MGGILSNSTNPNIDDTSHSPPAATMSSQSPESLKSDTQSQNADPKTLENQAPGGEEEEPQIDGERRGEDDEEEEEEEEQGECGFCLFMKGGGCKDTFIAWENCVEEADRKEEDVVEKCFEVTSNLKKCMEAHADYYEPILRAEKTAEEEAVKELEREAAKKDGQNADSQHSDDSAKKEG